VLHGLTKLHGFFFFLELTDMLNILVRWSYQRNIHISKLISIYIKCVQLFLCVFCYFCFLLSYYCCTGVDLWKNNFDLLLTGIQLISAFILSSPKNNYYFCSKKPFPLSWHYLYLGKGEKWKVSVMVSLALHKQSSSKSARIYKLSLKNIEK
jgi:hypothetical protein